MARYLSQRMLISLPMLLLVITLVFVLFQLIPGDVAHLYCGYGHSTPEEVEQKRKELGLDRPVLIQYISYLKGLVRGDLGKSIYTRRPVITEIKGRFWNTVQLSLVSIVMAAVLGIPMGIISAVKHNSLWDGALRGVALLGTSIPVFWLGLLLMYFFSVKLDILPSAGKETWLHYIMPGFNQSVFSMAFISRITRSCLLETIREDYVRTARAKGLPEYLVLIRHAVRNALVPIITVIGMRFGYMLGGAVITESIFAWPGMGRLLITAVGQRDIPLVQSAALVFATSFVLINVMVDIINAFLDPRIRYWREAAP